LANTKRELETLRASNDDVNVVAESTREANAMINKREGEVDELRIQNKGLGAQVTVVSFHHCVGAL
jgi:hypothetical protein